MGQMFRFKGNADVPPFDALRKTVVVTIEELLAGDAHVLIAMRAVAVAEDLIAIWDANKDNIELVEDK